MTPEQEQALKQHLQAIAKILYEDSDRATMQTLEGMEMTLRQQIQTHVSPELGSFLSKRLSRRIRAKLHTLRTVISLFSSNLNPIHYSISKL